MPAKYLSREISMMRTRKNGDCLCNAATKTGIINFFQDNRYFFDPQGDNDKEICD
jgi:hypothetical protein